MRTNMDLFADRGDPWNLPDHPRPPRSVARKRTHPDGFVEWTVRDDNDDEGPTNYRKPESTRIVNLSAKRRCAETRRMFNIQRQIERQEQARLRAEQQMAKLLAEMSKF